MVFEDKTIVCSDCGSEFVHTAESQERFQERGFQDPKRCPECRRQQKASSGGGRPGGGRSGGGGGGPRHGHGHGGGGGGGRQREEFEVVCASCGTRTTVPFKPRGDRPVYCRDCYRSART